MSSDLYAKALLALQIAERAGVSAGVAGQRAGMTSAEMVAAFGSYTDIREGFGRLRHRSPAKAPGCRRCGAPRDGGKRWCPACKALLQRFWTELRADLRTGGY